MVNADYMKGASVSGHVDRELDSRLKYLGFESHCWSIMSRTSPYRAVMGTWCMKIVARAFLRLLKCCVSHTMEGND